RSALRFSSTQCKSALNSDPTPKPRKVLIYITVFLQAGGLDRRRSRPLLDRVFPQHIHGFVGSQAGSLLDADPQIADLPGPDLERGTSTLCRHSARCMKSLLSPHPATAESAIASPAIGSIIGLSLSDLDPMHPPPIGTVYRLAKATRDKLRRWMFLPTLQAAHTAWLRQTAL